MDDPDTCDNGQDERTLRDYTRKHADIDTKIAGARRKGWVNEPWKILAWKETPPRDQYFSSRFPKSAQKSVNILTDSLRCGASMAQAMDTARLTDHQDVQQHESLFWRVFTLTQDCRLSILYREQAVDAKKNVVPGTMMKVWAWNSNHRKKQQLYNPHWFAFNFSYAKDEAMYPYPEKFMQNVSLITKQSQLATEGEMQRDIRGSDPLQPAIMRQKGKNKK